MPPIENIIFEQIKKIITSHNVVVFMNGTAVFPMCSESAQVVQILSSLGVVFKDVNVEEENHKLREGVKAFTNWPNVPHVFIKGEFIGSADMLNEMYQGDTLQALLARKDIPYAC